MTNEPSHIYLQVLGEDVVHDIEDTDFNDLAVNEGVTWNSERMYDTDLEYISIAEHKRETERIRNHYIDENPNLTRT